MREELKKWFRMECEDTRTTLLYFIRWGIYSLLAGLLGGAIGASFIRFIQYVTTLRKENPWILFCMPFAGLLIVFLHIIYKERGNKGTNLVLESVTDGKPVDKPIAPLIYICTILSHLVGASVGREGAALQIGGGLGDYLGAKLHFDEKSRKLAVMAGMSAVFAAVFGTPVAAAVFPIEVISVGIMHFSALVPCIFSSFIGYEFALFLGAGYEHFTVTGIPAFGLVPVLQLILLGILSGLVARIFCFTLHFSNQLYGRITKNPYLRILLASVIFIALTLPLRTDLYMGSGTELIELAIAGEQIPYAAFAFKILFTAIALGGKFKGGEIVPTLCIGACFGWLFGMLTGFSPSLAAACGMAALFVGVTNCPIATLLISLEMLSTEAMPFYSIVIAVSYCFSGYASLYASQRIMYSKTELSFINKRGD